MAVNVVINSGSAGIGIYVIEPGSSIFEPLEIPGGVGTYPRYPDHAEYRREHFIVGMPTHNLILLEDWLKVYKLGMEAPATAPTLAGSGGGTLSGDHIGYVTFRHKIGDEIIHESNGSDPSTTVTLNGSQQRAWSSIPTTSDERATHVVLYVSVDGAEPREVTELAIGTTTHTENTATASLGQVMPTNNGVPPYARYIEIYHDRLWFSAGDDKVWYSELEDFESVGEFNYINVRDGEKVTGLRRVRDQLVVGCRRVHYDIQGYDEQDFNMRKISPSIGLLSHFACKNIDERLWFPSEDGVYVYDGAQFVNTMDGKLRGTTRESETWRYEFDNNLLAYHASIAGIDSDWAVYRLLIKKPTLPRSFYWIGSYRDLERGQPIKWTIDIRDREDNFVGQFDNGDGALKTVTGSCDGKIREENVDSDGDDDGDTYLKRMTLLHGADYVGDAGGGLDHGKRFKDLEVYVENPTTSVGVFTYSGNPNCADGQSAEDFSIEATDISGALPETRKKFPLTRTTGETMALLIEAFSPVSVVYRGHAGTWMEGPRTRGRA
jgi:hypothetical protein